MTRTVCIANQKGGVGKTTTAVNLAAGLALKGHKTLLIDCDPQGNASSGLSVKVEEPPLLAAIQQGRPLAQGVVEGPVAGLHLLPASPELVEGELLLARRPDGHTLLKREVRSLSGYDYIVLDCPPSLGLLTVNALAAADSVLIPLQAEYYALEGLAQIFDTVRSVRRRLSPGLYLEGFLLTMYDQRIRLNYQVAREVRSHFGELVYRATIPRNVRLSESPSHGMSIFQYDPRSKGAQAYMAFVMEFLQRQRRR